MTKPIQQVVILGGGTAGWISAALLVKVLGKVINITLVESEQIGTVGVGEATIPPIQHLNQALGLSESDFLKATQGTIKLGIQFENWGKQGDSYMHAFGGIGKDFPFCDFQHFYLKAKRDGKPHSFWDYSLNYQAAKQHKFSQLNKIPNTNLPGLVYAYHFDASLYAQFLRQYAEAKGVKRIEGKVSEVKQAETGEITTLVLANGEHIQGDLFIDCSGLAALLIEKTLNTGYENWRHWLPCDSALAVPCENVDDIAPFTRSIAHDIGWQWRIPLQHRTGNGLVYDSRFCSDEQAKATLLANLDGKPLAELKLIRFQTGRRLKQWHKNVVSIGLSSGFLEPLESTSIHLIQSGITRLIKHFPHHGIKPLEVAEYNRQSKSEYETIRDFIILHYKLNQRTDSAFWRQCNQMDVPEALARKMALYQQTGKVYREQDELFTEIAWQQVLLGQNLMPADQHPLVDALSAEQLDDLFTSLKTLIDNTVAAMPSHQDYLTQTMMK